jgi:hypothetical protein
MIGDGAALVGDEAGEHQEAGEHGGERERVTPSSVGRVHDAEHQLDHAEGGGDRAEGVGLSRMWLGFWEVARRGEHHRQADGGVDEETDAPGQPAGEHPADHKPDGRGHARHGGVVGHGSGPFWSFGEARLQQRECRRRQDRGPDPLHGPGGDQPGL